MSRLIILFLLFQLNSFGQSAHIDTLIIPKNEKLAIADDLKFPIIKTNSKQIDSLINFDLKNRFTNNEFTDQPTDSSIIKWAIDQIVYLDFEVTYNQNGILSLNISAEGCGAYCTGWTEYYNYSLATGRIVTIAEIIDVDHFKPIVVRDKDKRYEQQRQELKQTLLNQQAELDQQGYEWALEYYNNCDESFELESFALHKDYLEIVARCPLPNAIKNMAPEIELHCKYADIREFLKIHN